MLDVKMRPNIQVKRELPPESIFWGNDRVGFTCGQCIMHHNKNCDQGICKFVKGRQTSCFPIRCRECNTNYCKWKRIQVWKERLIARFDYNRHRYIRMLTIGISGDKLYPKEILEDMIETWRKDLTTRFAKLRRTKYWDEHVDGGIWFFETTVHPHMTEGHHRYYLGADADELVKHQVNPHIHVVLLGRYLDQQMLQEELEKQGLGLPWITARDGASENIHSALDYCMAYLNKTPNYQGRQRDTFGCMRKPVRD